MTKNLAALALGLGLVGACATDDGGDDKPDQSDVKGGVDGKAEAWGPSDNPALFNTNLEYRASELPMQGAATNTPWASSYWPVYQDSINFKWGAGDPASTKYGKAFGVTGIENAVSQYHGIDAHASRTACTEDSQCNSALGESCSKRAGATSGRCIPTWWGICHAWAPAAILLPEPKKPVTYNGVEFRVNDIKALMTLVHDRTESRFVSLRCNALDSEQAISFDKYGRPNGGGSPTTCRDTNPGTFHVLMTNYLGKQGESFVYDRTWDGEVWNQPLRGYRITEMTEVSAVDANKLIGVGVEGGTTVERTGSAAGGAFEQVGSFPVTAGSNLTVVMSGTGDPDLHVKFGSAPTASSYDCRPYEGGAAETCNLTVPAGATAAFIGVAGYGTTAASFTLKITTGGSVPTNYIFNANAVKLLKTHMDVDYISESSSSTDGHLGANIDQYTHHDRYDYILELDANGKIIGGEWIGASKKQHPDFVWLPIRASANSVAGGKITYANVKMIYDLSMQDGGTTGGTPKTVNETGTVAKAAWKHYGPYNVAAGATFTAIMTGDNDADLYVRKEAAPTAAAYDCRPYSNGTSEQCSIIGPAKIYVGVNGYATTSMFQLVMTYVEGSGGTPPPLPPTTVTHVNTTGSVAQGEMKMFTVAVVAGRRIVVRTTSTKDVDLYVQMNAAPTTAAYLMRGYTSSGNETITYTPTTSGTLHIGVHGYEAGAFSVRSADL